MYTKLKHSEIREAILWLILKFKKHMTLKIRRKLCKYSPEKSTNVLLGNNAVSKKRYFTMTMTQLLAIISFDLDNTFFRIGKQLFRQFKGIPMGSNCSPPLAYLICECYERKIPQKSHNPDYSDYLELDIWMTSC